MERYVRGFDEKVFLHPREERYADELAKQEHIDPLTADNIFRTGVYIILAIREIYEKQFLIYNKLLKQGLDTPQAMLSDKDSVRKIVSASMKNKKPKYILDFAEWWMDSDWKNKLLEDVYTGRRNWYNLRGELAKNAPGMSYKSASFVMEASGYETPVVIDTWVLKYLVYKELIDKSFTDTHRGLSNKEYPPIEKVMTKLAEEHEMMPAPYRRALWVYNSNWKKTKSSLDQVVLSFEC